MEKKKREVFKFFFSLLFFFFTKFNINLLASSKNTKILTNPIFFKHHISKEHPESPERIKYLLNHLQKTNYVKLIEIIKSNRSVENWIKKVHTKGHISSLKKNHSIAEEVSRYAVRICLEAVDMIMNKESKNIFCAVRPPGHHALNTGKEEGFCYYNHIAITAKYIQKKYNLQKILIIDWDYHHGNSTELFFYNDPSVLFFSTHDKFAYPGTGLPSREGQGKGRGFNINVHLPCGTKDKKILSVFNKILIPKVNLFKPDFILVSSGFDSRIDDLLGCYKITDNGFKKLTKIITTLAKKYCDGRIISILEGGYNLDGNAKASIAHVSELNNLN